MTASIEIPATGTARSGRMRVVVAIASAGRPAILGETVRHMAEVLDPPADEILVCTPSPEDAEGLPDLPGLRAIIGRRGLPAQRNALFDIATDADIVVFFDDDFFPAPNFLERTLAHFEAMPDMVIATGHVILDGIHGPGLTVAQGKAAIAKAVPVSDEILEAYNAYGCNMAVRMEPVRRHGLRFDERLPLYGWLEDLDFSQQIARHGRSIRAADMIGVHLGVKAGRQPGHRLGYSQVANPWYLLGKKTMSGRRVLSQIARHVLANVVGSLRRDVAVDRRGRLVGNLAALLDILRGQSSPERALTFRDARKPGS